jgi:RHS repeat-associated protein
MPAYSSIVKSYTHDPVRNRTTAGNVTNAGNQLTADATHSYQYGDNGNLTRKTLLATGNYTSYTYDAENRLTKVEDFAAGNPTVAFTSTYRYDGLGRRIEKVANGQTKRYIYDGEDILLEYDGTNTLQARYTHGPGIDEPIAVTKGTTPFYYHQDGLGSVTDLTDSAGVTAKSYAYDAYGNILESPGTLDQPYTYTGREFDSESGLYHYRARYYDPATGIFLEKDPLGFVGAGINTYQYVRNNPVKFGDPKGLEPQPYVPYPFQYPNDLIGSGELGATVCKRNKIWIWIRPDILNDPDDQRCGIVDCLTRHELVHVADVFAANPQVCQGAPDNAKIAPGSQQQGNRFELRGRKLELDCLNEKLADAPCGCEPRLWQRLVDVSVSLGRYK